MIHLFLIGICVDFMNDMVDSPTIDAIRYDLRMLKGLFHPACFACVIFLFAIVVTIFMAHENGDKQRLAKR